MPSDKFHRLTGTLLFEYEIGGRYKGHRLADLEHLGVEIVLYPFTDAVRAGFDYFAASVVEVEGRFAHDEGRLVLVVNYLRQVFPTPKTAQA